MADRTPITNKRIANDLGVTHAAISRIRSGGRTPSLELMMRIERAIQWKLSYQAAAKEEGIYATKFEAAIKLHYIENQAPARNTFTPASAPYVTG